MNSTATLNGKQPNNVAVAIERATKTQTHGEPVFVAKQGDKIILPEGMDHDTAIHWLVRRKEEEEEMVGFSENIVGFALDGLAAFMRVLGRKYGWTHTGPTPGFFGDTPPTMITVETGYKQTMQLAIGQIRIPGIDGYFQTSIARAGAVIGLTINGEVKGKHKKVVEDLLKEVKDDVLKNSIYKGKAIKVDLGNVSIAPKFMDPNDIDPDDLILPRDVEAAIQTSLLMPIMKSGACRRMSIPLKRGVLLSGPFGTGKTMTAKVVAHHSQANNWTFFYLESVKQLKAALELARNYQPCVLFAEDLDRVLAGDRSTEMDGILNTLDGVDSKSVEVITVFTTNDVDGINKAMLRPGRLDAIIEVKAPDAEAAERLMRRYARGLADDTTNFTKAAALVAGFTPAQVRETVERAKLAAIYRDAETIGGDDVYTAALALKNQIDFLNGKAKKEPSVGHVIAERVGKVLEAVSGSKFVANCCGNPDCTTHGNGSSESEDQSH